MAKTITNICNDALSRIGEHSITDYDTGTDRLSVLCQRFYPAARRELLQSYEWSFATRHATIYQTTETPTNGFEFAYELPFDLLQMLKIYNSYSGTIQEYRIELLPSNEELDLEILTLDVPPTPKHWTPGKTVTGQTSTKTCVIIGRLSSLIYVITDRTGAFTLGEILSDGTNSADQGAANPTVATAKTDQGAFTRLYMDYEDSNDQAVIKYIADVEDPDKFPPFFQAALASALAAKLVIPVTGDLQLKQVILGETIAYTRQAMQRDGQGDREQDDGSDLWIEVIT